jgi:ATP-dependent DNA ligase
VRTLRLEGIIGKRNDSKYEACERSGAWIKHRTNREQEFVIGGYMPGARGFDALLVGIYIHQPSREESVSMGRIAHCGEDEGVPMDETGAGLSGCFRRMD